MSNEVAVTELPQCDFCGEQAEYDAKTNFGAWANVCQQDFDNYTSGQLGLGVGQRLVVLK
jgi:hypothetical protein